MLGAYGIAVPPSRRAVVAEAVEAADDVGYPVAVKAARRHLGRSVLAGVALDLSDGDDVFDSVAVMHAALGADADEVVVQAMIPPGLDLRMRSTVDERVGPLVAVGLGGATADLLVDESSRLAPLSPAGATALVGGSRAGPALEAAGLPTDAVVDTLLRLAQLVSDHPEVVFADLNPIVVSADRAWVTDATIAVGAGAEWTRSAAVALRVSERQRGAQRCVETKQILLGVPHDASPSTPLRRAATGSHARRRPGCDSCCP